MDQAARFPHPLVSGLVGEPLPAAASDRYDRLMVARVWHLAIILWAVAVTHGGDALFRLTSAA
jgi:hypothetical protein